MYKSLYIGNREGGIINEISKADQQGDPVVIVGLGGTGVDAISQLKIKLRKQIKPNNQDKIEKGEETEPVYSNIRFLGIDSDKGWMSGSALSDDEKMNLHNKFFKAMFMPDKLPALKADKRYQWMDIDYVATHLPPNTEGAGGLRQFARWLVIDHAQELKQKLSNIITNACMNKESGRLIIHVVSGISGGMGSGSFIDVCYILRHILNELGNNNALIYGYFVLPDAVISKDGIRSNQLKKQSNERNGMASLLEIEHLMNLHDSKEWFEQDYGAFYIRTQEQLVNLCHFVSATDTNGVLVTNAYEYSLNVIGDYIIAYLSNEKADKATDGESQPIDMRSNEQNFKQDLSQIIPEHGYSGNYVVIGSANGEIPTSQMATYLASALFNNMTISIPTLDDIQGIVTDREIKEFVNDIDMSDERINILMNKYSKNANWKPVTSDLVKQYYDRLVSMKHDVVPKGLIYETEDSLERRRSILLETQSNTIKKINDNHIPEPGATSLPAVIFEKLVTLAKNPEKGPYYAYGILNKTGASLDHYLEARESYFREKKKNARNQEAFFTEKERDVRNVLDDTGLMNYKKKMRIEDYTAALNNVYHWQAEADLYESLELMMSKVRAEVKKMNDEYFKKLKNVMDQLLDTFKANASYFSSGRGDQSADGFTLQIVKFSEILPKLNEMIKGLDKTKETAGILELMTNHPKVWKENKEPEIKNLISNYIQNKFKAILVRSMEDSLREKYNMITASSQAFSDKIKDDVISPLVDTSAPRFWTNDGLVNNGSQTSHRKMLSLPNSAVNIISAGIGYKGVDSKIEIRKSSISDRIYVLSTISAIPLYTYLGLINYRQTYENSDKRGVFLDYRDDKWKENLTFPYPYSLNHNYTKNADELLKLYKAARENGIITFNNTNAEIYIKRELGKDELKEDDLTETGILNEKLCNERINNLHDFLQSEPVKKEALLSVGCYTDRNGELIDQNVIDNFMRFAGVQNIVRNELEKNEHAANCIKKLETLIAEARVHKDRQTCYFNTILVEGFEDDPFNLIYKYTSMGREEEIILCKNGMPYSGLSKYYQGYVSFLNIEQIVYDELRGKTNFSFDTLMKSPEKALNRVNKLLNINNPQMLSSISHLYDGKMEKDSIDLFYKEFVEYLSNLKLQLNLY